jgi:DNA-binding XRE family transcriptional regulator
MAGRGGPKTNGFGVKKAASHLVVCPRCQGKGKIEPDTMSIGDRLRACRMKLEKRQDEIAPLLHISRAQLANLEGDRSRPGIETIVACAKVYGVSVDYLLGLAE